MEVIYGITSLPRGRIDAKHILTLIREHWSIENKLHYVRDVTFGEEPAGAKMFAREVLAGIRNAALSLLNRLKPKSMTAAQATEVGAAEIDRAGVRGRDRVGYALPDSIPERAGRRGRVVERTHEEESHAVPSP